jgi:enamine deaminase RidA (YjgF/YER057c/UK114 family)
MSYDARVGELGIELPGPFPPHDPLDAVVVFNGSARTSGCLPRNAGGVLHATGLLGRDVSTEVGTECARWCALNALSLLRAELGTLDRVERVLTVTGFVACTGDFAEQPTVVDGASRLLHDLFGAAGRHTRSAIGVAALPRRGPVEIEVTVALRD